MPNYRYKCECGYEDTFALPISSDPKDLEACPECPGIMYRIITSTATVVQPKETLGEWFKKQTGKELLGGE